MKRNQNSPLMEMKGEDAETYLNFIRKEVQRRSGLFFEELATLSEHQIFYISLKHVTTTKKAVCEAFNLKVEAMCREKRKLQNQGKLVEVFKATCPITGANGVAYLSTNPNLIKSLWDGKR